MTRNPHSVRSPYACAAARPRSTATTARPRAPLRRALIIVAALLLPTSSFSYRWTRRLMYLL